MQFLLIAYDGSDPGAPGRRMAVRPQHLEKIAILKNTGEFLLGGAILDEQGGMIGSMIVYEFPDKEALEEKLKDEPYILNNVWQKIEIKPFRMAKIKQA